MYRLYRKILHLDEGDFKMLVKSGMFRRNVMAHFGSSLKIRELLKLSVTFILCIV